MRYHRFFIKKPLGEETFIQDISFAYQIETVLRLLPGDSVIFYNGEEPFDYLYRIDEYNKSSVRFCLLEKITKPSFSPRTVLFLSKIKKDLFELCCLKATELGVTDIVPIETSRTQKHFLQERRLETILKEASEQSGRNDVPTLHDTVSLSDALAHLGDFSLNCETSIALSLQGDPVSSSLQKFDNATALGFFVGPEGGWTEDEETYFTKNNIMRLSVSPYTLRAETAGIICTYLAFLMRK
jgi:16S rRNA (uracil1498-N3)-methyltransferase